MAMAISGRAEVLRVKYSVLSSRTMSGSSSLRLTMIENRAAGGLHVPFR